MSQIISLLVLCVLLLSGLGVTMAQTDEREMYDQQQLKLKRDNPAEYEKQRRFFRTRYTNTFGKARLRCRSL